MIYTKTFEYHEIELDGLSYFCTFNAEGKEHSWGGTYFDAPEYDFDVRGISDLEIVYFENDGDIEVKVTSDIIIDLITEYICNSLEVEDFIN
jgi:hypothetical protein